MRRTYMPGMLLTLCLLFAAMLRFTGQNWDDFSHSHPDERFLTALLLPQIGGHNSFTADEIRFPAQELLVAGDATEPRNRNAVLERAGSRLGVVRDTFSAEAALWLVDEQRLGVFNDRRNAELALIAGDVDALLVNEREAAMYSDSLKRGGTFRSEDLQSERCRWHYPHSDGRGGYFDTRCSPLNPHNAGHGLYVYGTFPLFLAHFGSDLLRSATESGLPIFDFQGGHLTWRGMSAIFDLLTIVAIFLLGRRVRNNWVGLLAAVFYAAAPLAIQKAHFGTVNAVTSCLVTVALYFAVAAQQRGGLRSYILFGLFTGAAVASRINVAPLAGIIIVAAGVQAAPIFDAKLTTDERKGLLARVLLGLVLSGFAAFFTFRLLNPYAFSGPGFFGLLPNPRWLANLESIGAGVTNAQDFPPSWQWLARSSLVYTMKDMLFWAMGLGFGVLGWFGWCWAAYRLLRNRKAACDLVAFVIWVGGYYIFMSRLSAQTMRYYLPLYSSLAILAAWCLHEWKSRAEINGRSLPNILIPMLSIGGILAVVGVYQIANGAGDATAFAALAGGGVLLASAVIPPLSRYRPLILAAFAVAYSLVWGLMFSNVYRHQTTLVQSARYLFERVPGDFAMRIEGADDSVPLINIAFHNSGYTSNDLQGSPFNRANHYIEGDRQSVSFRAPASGTVKTIYAPHLGDPLDDPTPEALSIEIREEGSDALLATARLYANLARDRHPLGESYTIPLDLPLEVSEGERYTFVVEVEPGSGDVIGSGSVVLTEGSWDNHVTGMLVCQKPEGITLADDPPSGLSSERNCHGAFAFSALVNSQDQIMSYPVDNQTKYDDILRTLDIGDYLTIASNRFYDTEPRNQMRWPLTTLYYEKLFAGELGFELEAVFEETFELGPLRVSDQRLPVYDSPYWLNEIEADEAFHVYDHPAVFIFRKTEAYQRSEVEAILSRVSLKQSHELHYDDSAAQYLGVFYWLLTDAEPAPTGLMFTPDEREAQTAGGSWSERFFSDSLINTNQALGVLVWYLTIFVFGALAFPLVYRVLSRMADGGYGVAKLVGLLVVAWFAWAVSSLKIPIWSQSGILLSLLLLALLSAGFYRIRLVEFLRGNWRRLAWIEAITFAAFLVMIGVRLTNPDLWHPAKGGEKPMDFTYLNGVLRSTTFPPIDPWFSGGFINYYYFGYVLLGAPTLLLGVVPAFAYNLMIPTVFSLTGIGAFSAAFNIYSRWRRPSGDSRQSKPGIGRIGSAWIAGIMALILCVVLGNLDTVRVFGNEIAQHGGYRKPEGRGHFLIEEYEAAHGYEASEEVRAELAKRAAELHPWDSLRYEFDSSRSLVSGTLQGIGRILQGEQPHINSDRWYWGPSRVLAETPGVRGNAITEMPYFTFLYGDLHAHMINMPLILLSLLLLFNEVAWAGDPGRRALERILALLLLGLTVGVMRATNTWDWPTLTLLSVLALAFAWWTSWRATCRPLQDGRFYASLVGVLVLAVVIVTVLSSALPDQHLSAASLRSIATVLRVALVACIGMIVAWLAVRYVFVRASALELAGSIGGFMILNLAFALPYTSWYASTYNSVQLWQGGKTPLWAYFDIHGLFLFLIVSLLLWDTSLWFRSLRVKALIDHRLATMRILATVALAGLVAIVSAMAGYQVALIVLPLVCWVALLFFRAGQSPVMRFLLALIGLALSITLGVEIIVIGGDIGRQNTVFKFYIQVWLLLSVACGVAFACLLEASERFSRNLKIAWYAPCILLFAIASLFPIMATRGRSFDRMAPDLPATLNGMDYMTRAKYHEYSRDHNNSRETELSVDHQLIRWLQENVEGSPVIIEGRQPGGEYRWNGRISITTGLPSVLGWNWHQRQQRTLPPMHEWIYQRERNVLQFYNTADIDIAVDTIHHFQVKYIVHSALEEVHSTDEGLEKFERMVDLGLLTIAFEVPGGRIYKVDDEAVFAHLVERKS